MPAQGESFDNEVNSPRVIPPPPASIEQADIGLERWRDLAERAAEPRGAAMMALLDGPHAGLLRSIFGNSPFLTHCTLTDPEAVLAFADHGPDRVVDDCLMAVEAPGTIAETDKLLRQTRRRLALVTALADLSGIWPLARVTAALSHFADAAIDCALGAHLKDAVNRGFLTAGPDGNLPRDGFIVLGMGKLGGGELNYSSDIDLIVFYDPDVIATPDPDGLRERVIRITRGMVASLQHRTADGYVFRVDLRLRPDPGSTPVAVSVPAALTYYESLGQNWERAAMIRSRAVAGDKFTGQAFLDELQPFVWRRSLDFATIQDVHSIKRQIYAQKGGEAVAVEGHNVKLGRGGIREIEFFAQTQQLIFGGRNPTLRSANTMEALFALVEAGLVDEAAAKDLEAAYDFLRTVEHRLQMIDDQQTHSLPEDAEGLRRVAVFMGYQEPDAFRHDLLHHLGRVEQHYARLFEEEAPLSSGPGNLVFTGADHDPETLATLQTMGFRQAETVSTRIRAWHHGRYRATHSTRSRQLLTELVPTLLEALADTANPDEAFTRFDGFLSGLPTGVQLFSLFHAHPELLNLVAEVMGTAPRLASQLSRRPVLLDRVLSDESFERTRNHDDLVRSLDLALMSARDYEEVLDTCRRWAGDQQFLAGVQFLRGTLDAVGMGQTLSTVADTVIDALIPRVEEEFAKSHGHMPNGRFCVIGLGKLGGRELSATSDLDLVFVYSVDRGATEKAAIQSDGDRPLSASHYYARFAQRLFNALTSPTAEGKLYEVDMRLRPAGSKGPLASSLDAFVSYQKDEAWTWEQMALTRARLVAGDRSLGDDVMDVVGASVRRERDTDELILAVADMRQRIAKEHGKDSIWASKNVRGGLVDIEFMAQYLMLRHTHRHPDVVSNNTADAFERMGAAGCIDADFAKDMAAAARLWQQVQALLRLTVGEDFEEEGAPDALIRTLVRVAGLNNLTELKQLLTKTAAGVMANYDRIIENPAAALREATKDQPS